ncbi:MAG: hypothetical protein CM15mP127_15470 [Gammaproteobacteria bacterium]|nr:MAG: hypothetical protein CM15mP127_15470 [Gammaproteobacteria bacterium]
MDFLTRKIGEIFGIIFGPVSSAKEGLKGTFSINRCCKFDMIFLILSSSEFVQIFNNKLPL